MGVRQDGESKYSPKNGGYKHERLSDMDVDFVLETHRDAGIMVDSRDLLYFEMYFWSLAVDTVGVPTNRDRVKSFLKVILRFTPFHVPKTENVSLNRALRLQFMG